MFLNTGRVFFREICARPPSYIADSLLFLLWHTHDGERSIQLFSTTFQLSCTDILFNTFFWFSLFWFHAEKKEREPKIWSADFVFLTDSKRINNLNELEKHRVGTCQIIDQVFFYLQFRQKFRFLSENYFKIVIYFFIFRQDPVWQKKTNDPKFRNAKKWKTKYISGSKKAISVPS